jgi:hypothetical protein
MQPVKVLVYQGTKINQRLETGFHWRHGEDRTSDPYSLRITRRYVGDGFTIAWGIGRNVFKSYLPVTMRQIRGDVYLPQEARPVAHLSFDLFRAKRGRYVDGAEFIECCDTFSQEVYDLAYGITQRGCPELEEYFGRGPIMHFRGMEVRPPFNGHGYGVRFAKAFIANLLAEYGAHAVFLKPFPLQFEGAGRARDEAGRTLAQARKKLAAYYVRTLNCKRVCRESDYYYLEP